jgi:excisionase family DNA binding protein
LDFGLLFFCLLPFSFYLSAVGVNFPVSDTTPQKNETREEFLTARQLAQVLQVSESTVRRLAQKGRIPSIRLTPRLLRFHLPAVRDALDGTQRSRAHRQQDSETDNLQLSFTDLLTPQ